MPTVPTVCGYCGVGCGMDLHVADGVVTKATGRADHPANRGRLCTKGATTADMLRAGGRLTTALVRPERGAEAVADRRGHRRRGGGRPAVGDPRRARPGRGRPLRVRADVHRGAVPGEQAGQGLSADAVDRVELAAVHGQRGHRLQAVARRRRPARLLRRPRPRRRVPRHRREHGRLPPDPVPADDGPGPGRREADRRRSPPHRHRGQGRPVPAGAPGHRPRAAERAAATGARRGRRGRPTSSPTTPRAGRRWPRSSTTTRPTWSPRSPGSPRRTCARPRTLIGDAPNWMSLWTMGLNQSHPRHLEHQRAVQPAPRHRRDLPPRRGPVLADRPAERDGRPGDGLHGPGPARAAVGARRRRPRVRRGAVGAANPARSAPRSAPAPSTCSEDGRRRDQGLLDHLHQPRRLRGQPGTVIAGLERAELVVTQDAFADTETNAYADVVLPAALWAEADGVMVNTERTLTHCGAAHRPARRGAAGLAADRRVATAHGLRRGFAFDSAAEVFDGDRRLPQPRTGYDLRGVDYDRLRRGPVQWPAAPGGADRNPIRYLNDGVSQDLLTRRRRHRAARWPSRHRAVAPGSCRAAPARRRAARRRLPVRAQHRPAAAPVAHHDQDRPGGQAEQAQPRTVRRAAPRRRRPARSRRRRPGRDPRAGPRRAAGGRRRRGAAGHVLRAVPLERRVRTDLASTR